MGRVVDTAKLIERLQNGKLRLLNEYSHKWASQRDCYQFQGGIMMLERVIDILENEFNEVEE